MHDTRAIGRHTRRLRTRDVGISAERIRRWGRLVRRPQTYRLLLAKRAGVDVSSREGLARSLDWLLQAHAAASGNGFASHYSVESGWGPPFPETSGYLVPTLLAALPSGHRSREVREAVDRTGGWLLRIQDSEGAFEAPATKAPMVFDTGQVLFGLLALSALDGNGGYLEAARRAGDWIVSRQEREGCWTRNAYKGLPHTYYARVSWALLALFERCREERFRDAARRQLRWVVSQQRERGWFSRCSFYADDRPVSHVIAYTIEGLWESARLLEDSHLERAALVAAESLLESEGGSGRVPGYFRPVWSRSGRDVCVTGVCQMARVWLRMAAAYGREDFASAARRCLAFARRQQLVDPGDSALHGGLPGSVPVWGEYISWSLPNWGAKFFLDALLQSEGLEGNAPPG